MILRHGHVRDIEKFSIFSFKSPGRWGLDKLEDEHAHMDGDDVDSSCT